VHAPEVRKEGGIEPFVGFGRGTERIGRLPHIVLKEPGLSKRASDVNLIGPG
jgi:hypothetical protein